MRKLAEGTKVTFETEDGVRKEGVVMNYSPGTVLIRDLEGKHFYEVPAHKITEAAR